jgi:phosphoribosylformylglycinamidine cyclo-ligase
VAAERNPRNKSCVYLQTTRNREITWQFIESTAKLLFLSKQKRIHQKEPSCMPKKLTYSNAGVDREKRRESKKHLKKLKDTYKLSKSGSVLKLPYGNVFPISQSDYLDLVIEGVGTKVLVAQLANKYDTIGIDAVAMAVNDVIRSGAEPLAIADNIHAQASEPKLVEAWLQGIAKAAIEAECPVTGGEIGDVAEIIKGIVEGQAFDMIVAAVGRVSKQEIITGENIKPDDTIIGLPSNGLHSNGISLARKILFSKWGGKYEPEDIPDGSSREIALEVLEPTKIYVKPLLAAAHAVKVKAAVHITGDAYLKFNNLTRFSPGLGFEFNNFKPHRIFDLIQKTALELGYTVSDEEMFRTFNMGWGFAIIVDKAEEEKATRILEKTGAQPEKIGKVTATEKIVIHHRKRKMILT